MCAMSYRQEMDDKAELRNLPLAELEYVVSRGWGCRFQAPVSQGSLLKPC